MKLIDFPGDWFGSVEPAKVLQGAIDFNLDEVVVIGRTKDGTIQFFASNGHMSDALLLIEQWKTKVLTGGYGALPGSESA